MVVQLPDTCGRAQCLATLQSAQAPAVSPVAFLRVNIPSRSGHCQPPSPPLPVCSVNCGSKQPIKPSCTRRREGEKGRYLGQGQAHLLDNPGLHPTAVYTYLMCGRCGTKGSQSPAAPAASTPAQGTGQHPAPPSSSAGSWQQLPGSVAHHPALGSLGRLGKQPVTPS